MTTDRRIGYVNRVEANGSSTHKVNVHVIAGWGNAEFEYPADQQPRIGDRIVVEFGENLGPQT